MSTYLAVTTKNSAQMISDRMPSTTVSFAGWPGADRGQHRLAHRVERAGADVAINDADAAERERPEAGLDRRQMLAIAIGRGQAAAGGGNALSHEGYCLGLVAMQKNLQGAAYNAGASAWAPSFAQLEEPSHAQTQAGNFGIYNVYRLVMWNGLGEP